MCRDCNWWLIHWWFVVYQHYLMIDDSYINDLSMNSYFSSSTMENSCIILPGSRPWKKPYGNKWSYGELKGFIERKKWGVKRFTALKIKRLELHVKPWRWIRGSDRLQGVCLSPPQALKTPEGTSRGNGWVVFDWIFEKNWAPWLDIWNSRIFSSNPCLQCQCLVKIELGTCIMVVLEVRKPVKIWHERPWDRWTWG